MASTFANYFIAFFLCFTTVMCVENDAKPLSNQLDGLPNDNLDRISVFLHPLDILHLRSTNRAFKTYLEQWKLADYLKTYALEFCNGASIISLTTMLTTDGRFDPVFDFFKTRSIENQTETLEHLFRNTSRYEADYLALFFSRIQKPEYLPTISMRMTPNRLRSTLSKNRKLAHLNQLVLAAIGNKTNESVHSVLRFIHEEIPFMYRSVSIHHCVRRGREDLTRLLLDHGANPNVKISFSGSQTLLMTAFKLGRVKIARLLLDRGALLSPPTYVADLFKAVESKENQNVETKLTLVKLLIKAGVNVNSVNHMGKAPLHFVQDEEVADLLIKYGADVNQKDTRVLLIHKCTYPLDVQIKKGNAGVVETLLKANAKSELSFNEALIEATYAGHFDVASILIRYESKFRLDYDDWTLETPLHGAAWSSLEMTHLLDSLNLPVNAQNLIGRTPLHRAAYRNHLDIMKKLLQSRADPNIVDSNKDAPIHIAVVHNNIDAIKLLLKYKADIGLLTSNYLNFDSRQGERWHVSSLRQYTFLSHSETKISVLVLCILSEICSSETFSFLVEKNAPLDTLLQKQYNLLHVMASVPFSSRYHKMLDVITENAPQLFDAINEYGNTPLCQAIIANTIHVNQTVHAFLDRKENLVSDDCLPLHIAARLGLVEVGRILIEKGANIDRREPQKGMTSLQVATIRNNIEFSNMLMEFGARR